MATPWHGRRGTRNLRRVFRWRRKSCRRLDACVGVPMFIEKSRLFYRQCYSCLGDPWACLVNSRRCCSYACWEFPTLSSAPLCRIHARFRCAARWTHYASRCCDVNEIVKDAVKMVGKVCGIREVEPLLGFNVSKRISPCRDEIGGSG